MSSVLLFSSFTDVSYFSAFALSSLFSLSSFPLMQVLVASKNRRFYLVFTFLLLFLRVQVQGHGPTSTSPHVSGVHTPHNERANDERTYRYEKDHRHAITHLTPSPPPPPGRQSSLLLHPPHRREKRETEDVGEKAIDLFLKDQSEGRGIPDRSVSSPLSSFSVSDDPPPTRRISLLTLQ